MTIVSIISAPSGSGKSTLVNKVREIVPGLHFSVSYTTRAPRGNEQNQREYFFISRPEFQEMIHRDEFLEHAEVHGNCYGTARRFLLEAEQKGCDLLLDIDVQGAGQIKSKIPQAVSIFILPPNRSQLEQRLRDRGQDPDAEIQRRLDKAKQEIENYCKYDYILVNDDLQVSIEALKSILLAERFKRSVNQQLRPDDAAKIMAAAEQCRLANVGERLRPILASFEQAAAPGARPRQGEQNEVDGWIR